MSFNIGVNRNVIVKSQDDELVVIIEETGTDKRIVFTDKRWVQFLHMIEDIDNAVNQLNTHQYVSYQAHIGGKWFVTVTTGFLCINLRQFYMNTALGLQPTRRGIALRVPEWVKLKEVITDVTDVFQNEGNSFSLNTFYSSNCPDSSSAS
jgi:Transcriptional Coactivator p15 (PC4)